MKYDRVRPCPSCSIPIQGTQYSQDKDWHLFICTPCEEEWGENIRYCMPEMNSPVTTDD